ncbi:YfhJ family protein [Falsibacillus albus]|uniref:WVELL protein n=1 Tax=Falsibacillus albus TaxID=2478915 RepID=A0A3L7JNH6_9BACI|nr:YfhJ family protein [Falsibacillus albus]RLQ92377.1 hypothetical protein D9X91_19190 [Falsibacillus albus]
MNEYIDKLTDLLLIKNDQISHGRARSLVELLWEDFETTYAKAGHEYKGREMTAKVVIHWIEQYGERLHEFAARNPRYKHLLEDSDDVKH